MKRKFRFATYDNEIASQSLDFDGARWNPCFLCHLVVIIPTTNAGVIQGSTRVARTRKPIGQLPGVYDPGRKGLIPTCSNPTKVHAAGNFSQIAMSQHYASGSSPPPFENAAQFRLFPDFNIYWNPISSHFVIHAPAQWQRLPG